jgi:hypothetical protein
MRIRIRIRTLVNLSGQKKLKFYMRNILKVGYRSKSLVPTKVQSLFKGKKPDLQWARKVHAARKVYAATLV